jgi:iron complex outermembrane receptor protein
MKHSQQILRATTAFLLVSLFALPTGAFAQSEGTPEAYAATDEIIVTAQRKSESLERTPVAVAVVSSDALARQAITSERDLQFATPGLTVRASQNDNQLNFSLRGQTVDAYTSSLPSVLPYINEVQVGGGASSTFYDLQSVQVLKGPQGTLFGRNATGGAVLFTTAKPTDQLEGYVTGRIGRFNEFSIEGAINFPISDQILFRLAGTSRTRDGIQKNLYYDNRHGKIDRQGLRASLTLFPDGSFTNEVVLDYYRAGGSGLSAVVTHVVPVEDYVAGYPFVPDAIIYPGLEDFGAAQKERGPFVTEIDSVQKHRTRRTFLSNISTLDISEDVQIKNVFGYIHNNYFESGDIDGTPFGIDGRGDASTGPLGGDGLIKQISNEFQLIGKTFDGRLDFVTGLYYSDSSESLINNSLILYDIGLPIQINAGKTTSKSLAGYAQGTLDTGLAGIKLTAGLRYTSEKIKFTRYDIDNFSSASPVWGPFYEDGRFIAPQKDTFKKLSWTFGLQNQVTNDLLLYANTRRSFRSGGFNFHAPPTPGFANTSGGEFRPEVATDLELGAKFRGFVGDMPARLNLAVYNMWVKNVQRANYVAIFDALAGITVNVPRAKVTGFEIDGSIEPADWLRIGGSLNYTNARFTSNQVPVLGTDGVSVSYASFDTYPDTPDWSGVFYTDVTVPVSEGFNATLHGDVYAQSSTYYSSTGKSLNPFTKSSGYALVNFRVGLEQRNGRGLSIAALVKNAFKKEYYTGGIGFASLFGLNIEVPGEPRTFLFELGYKF